MSLKYTIRKDKMKKKMLNFMDVSNLISSKYVQCYFVTRNFKFIIKWKLVIK